MTQQSTRKVSRDLEILALEGKGDADYIKLIQSVKSGLLPKDAPKDHPIVELGSVYEELKVEETAEGELVFKGTHLVPPKVSRKKLVEQSHSIHQSGETI